MDDEEKFWLSVTTLMCAVFLVIVICITIDSYHSDNLRYENNYCEYRNIGSERSLWKKCKGEK